MSYIKKIDPVGIYTSKEVVEKALIPGINTLYRMYNLATNAVVDKVNNKTVREFCTEVTKKSIPTLSKKIPGYFCIFND